MNIANEKWETIASFTNYMISSESRVMNKTTLKMISIGVHKHGHRVVRLWNRGKTKLMKIYRLKAIAFIPNPHSKREVNHKDGNRLNEELSNLEWSTPKENMRHAIDNGFCGGQYKRGFEHIYNKLSLDDINLIKRWRGNNSMSLSTVGKIFGITPDHVCRISRGKVNYV